MFNLVDISPADAAAAFLLSLVPQLFFFPIWVDVEIVFPFFLDDIGIVRILGKVRGKSQDGPGWLQTRVANWKSYKQVTRILH